MSTKWTGVIFGLTVVLVINIGAFWFGQSFKFGVAVLVVSASIFAWLLLRRRKAQFLRDLAQADRETQDAALAELDADDRKEVLRKLKRYDA